MKTNWVKPLKRYNRTFNLQGEYRYKGQTYRVQLWLSSRGPRSKGAITNIWRVSDNPENNNENGVIPGARSTQGPYSETALRRLINRVRW